MASRDLFGRHADALVGDRDGEALRGVGARHDDGGVGWRERRRVLEQFGEEVGEVGDGASRHGQLVVDAHEIDAWEVGDLRRCRADDVEQADRLLPLAGLLGARQDEEALRVAAHAGRHVVELEQGVERGGIVLVALELVEQFELTLEQALVAAGQVHEQVAHALAQQLGLVARDLHGHGFDVVERLRELADLVGRVDLDRGKDDRVDLAAGSHRLDELWELLLRHLPRALGELAQRADHGAGHDPDQRDREEHREHGGAAVQPDVAASVRRLHRGTSGDRTVDRFDRTVEVRGLLLVLGEVVRGRVDVRRDRECRRQLLRRIRRPQQVRCRFDLAHGRLERREVLHARRREELLTVARFGGDGTQPGRVARLLTGGEDRDEGRCFTRRAASVPAPARALR